MSKKQKTSLEEFSSITDKHLLVLNSIGVTTISALAEIPPLELKNLLETTLSRAALIIKEARSNLPPFVVKDASMILENNKSRNYLSTNCKAIDQLLGGRGLESGSITEVYAQYGTGKSQFAFSTIVSALCNDPAGNRTGGSVIVVDTEGTCSPERLLEMLQYYKDRLDQSPEQTLKHIKIISPLDSVEQKTILKLFLEDEGSGYSKYMNLKRPLRLLVVDSLVGLFRSQYIGRGVLAQRQQKLNDYMRDLYLFGVKNDIPIFVTNQVMASPDPFTPVMSAVGGHVVAHASTYRIHLVKRKNFRLAKMVDSSRLPETEVMFKLGRKGLMDLDDSDEKESALDSEDKEDKEE